MPVYSFYRPHDRATTWFTGELVNPLTGEVYKPPARTKQAHVAECDINNIIKQYRLSGQVQHMAGNAAQGAYRDLPDSSDFQESLNTVLVAQRSFATLPAHVRQRFGNDPDQFLQFMGNPDNQDEIIALGLARDLRPPPATPVADPPA